MRNYLKNIFSLGRKAKVARPKSNYLQRTHPKVYWFFSIVKDGTKTIALQTLSFLRIKFKLMRAPNEHETKLTWNEIEIYRQIPRDWRKVAPVMIISAFPLLSYVILPVAYMYPHRLLCQQLWTLDQKLQFAELDHIKRMDLHDQLLDLLVLHADRKLDFHRQSEKYAIIDCISKVKKGEKISVEEVISLKPILAKPEFSISRLSETHINLLVKFHECKRVFDLNPYSNVRYYSFWLRRMDSELNKLDLRTIPLTSIYNMCYERGISAYNIPINDLLELLKIWLAYSDQLFDMKYDKSQSSNYTLYLHSKVLFRDLHQHISRKLLHN